MQINPLLKSNQYSGRPPSHRVAFIDLRPDCVHNSKCLNCLISTSHFEADLLIFENNKLKIEVAKLKRRTEKTTWSA